MKAGEALGRYEILSRIARGGMAEVWLARAKGEQGFRKKVVIKTILPHLAEDPEFTRMFINEALLAARLDHPHIVQIFDLGSRDESYYIAMEHVPGRSLRQVARELLHRGKGLPSWLTMHVLAAVCDGLQYAHDLLDDSGQPLGLVHRDVSPENIMVSHTGMVKVLDFGVAKATKSASLTRAGTLKGKYSYMAPEQILGRAVDRRMDIYSVGVILYELLTRRRPFQGSSDLDLLKQITEARVIRPRALVPTMPERLEQTILTALARDPAQRFSQASELGDELHACLKEMGDSHTQRDMGALVRGLFPDSMDQPAAAGASRPPQVLLDKIKKLKPRDTTDTTAKTDQWIAEAWMADVQRAVKAEAASAGDTEVTPPAESKVDEPGPAFDSEEIVFTFIGRGGAGQRPRQSTEPDEAGEAASPIAADGSSRSGSPFTPSRSSGPQPTGTFGQGKRRSRKKRRRRPGPFTTGAAPPSPSEQEDVPGTVARALQHFDRGLEHKRRGELGMALIEWQAAVEIDPGNKKYRFNLERLKTLTEDPG